MVSIEANNRTCQTTARKCEKNTSTLWSPLDGATKEQHKQKCEIEDLK